MKKKYFITGTDTNIGKTVAACAILQAAELAGYIAIGYKPVSSGCQITDNGARNSDALALIANSTVSIPYHMANPIALIEPTAPNIASLDEKKIIEIAHLSTNLQDLQSYGDWLVIEGAGGWFTPLSEKILFSDWVIAEEIPVIIVVGLKLGCINHALLTKEAIKKAGLPLAGWIANHINPSTNRPKEYISTLKSHLDIPMLGEIPWLTSAFNDPLSDFINLKKLL